MEARCDIRSEFDGWTVCDARTGSPALINHVPQTALAFEDADDLADLLNHMQAEQSRAISH
jgi:hypothetical protein